MSDIDLCCPCARDTDRRRRTKHPTVRRRVRFKECGHVHHAINLRWDIWPLCATCPTCERFTSFEFMPREFRPRTRQT